MKKIVIASLIAAPALALSACGGASTTENVTVSNEVVLNEGDLVTDNFATDAALNETANAVDTADAVTENALEGASNVVGNTAE